MAIAFGDCELDRNLYQLRRRGKPAKIEPKVFDVLCLLVEHRDRVVTKHELLDTLWPGEAVSDSVLPRCIAAARRVVGDDRTRQRVIQTVHGRGYRFVAECHEAQGVASKAVQPPPSPAADAASPTSTRATFVGRENALNTLATLLDRARRRAGEVVLVVGEPGIGKTAIVEELARRATRSGFEVLVGRCYEGDGAPAYWPWVQILRAAARDSDPAALRQDLGLGLPDIAALVPELSTLFPDLPPATGPEGEQARFRLYDAIAGFVGRRAERRPLLIILDDIHWGDASSLGLFRFIAQSLSSQPVMIAATYRDVEVRRGLPLADLLGALARETQCERVALSGFDPEEVGRFVEAHAEGSPSEEMRRLLREMTDGNPFFLREMVRLLVDEGNVEDVDPAQLHALALPQGVRDAIGRRLDGLSSECNEMLRAAAVLGREFSLPVLEAMLDIETDALLELVAEALVSGAIVEPSATRGSYSFAHALTRQTLYDELRAPRRIQLHRKAGACLERVLGTRAADHRSELAHHYFEAAAGGDVEKAVYFALEAARDAHQQYAYDEAAALYAQAAEAAELSTPVDEQRRGEILLAHGEALFTAGHRERAQSELRGVADLARRLGDTRLFARAVIAILRYGAYGTRPPEGVPELLQEALDVVGDDHPGLRASLLSRVSGGLTQGIRERRALADEAMELARRSQDSEARADALSACWWAAMGPDAPEERLDVVRQMRALAEELDDPAIHLLSLECELGALLLLGDREGIERVITDFDVVATRIRQPLFLFMARTFRASWLLSQGYFDEAAEAIDRAMEIGRNRVPFAAATHLGHQYWALVQRGEPVGRDAMDLAEVLRDFETAETLVQLWLAGIELETGQHEAVRLRIAAIDIETIDRNEHWLLTMGLLSDLAFALDDRALAARLYEQLTPYSHLMAVHDLLRTMTGSVSSCLGELATTLGDLDAAVGHYEDAIRRESDTGLLSAVVSSELGLARVLERRGGPGDGNAARERANSAGRAAKRLGMSPRLRMIRLEEAANNE